MADTKKSQYVLIVDDDPDAQEILKRMVGALGIRTEVVGDGKAALTHITSSTPSLILLDLMMPQMDGFQVLNILRSVRRTRDIPVIVITAYSNGQSDALHLPGVLKVIQKSGLRLADFQKEITNALNIKPAPAEGGDQEQGQGI